MNFHRGEFAIGLFLGAAFVLLGYLWSSSLGAENVDWNGQLSVIASVCSAVAAVASLVVAITLDRRELGRNRRRGVNEAFQQVHEIWGEIDELSNTVAGYVSYDVAAALIEAPLTPDATEALRELRVERKRLLELSRTVLDAASDLSQTTDLADIEKFPLLVLTYREDLREIRRTIDRLLPRIKSGWEWR